VGGARNCCYHYQHFSGPGMHFEICFLNKHRRLACVLNATFLSAEHAAHYAHEVMQTAACRDFDCAELYTSGKRELTVRRPPVRGQKPRLSLILGGKALAS
jgi:hypothetical protein